jgi:hypothetical protein
MNLVILSFGHLVIDLVIWSLILVIWQLVGHLIMDTDWSSDRGFGRITAG